MIEYDKERWTRALQLQKEIADRNNAALKADIVARVGEEGLKPCKSQWPDESKARNINAILNPTDSKFFNTIRKLKEAFGTGEDKYLTPTRNTKFNPETGEYEPKWIKGNDRDGWSLTIQLPKSYSSVYSKNLVSGTYPTREDAERDSIDVQRMMYGPEQEQSEYNLNVIDWNANNFDQLTKEHHESAGVMKLVKDYNFSGKNKSRFRGR